MTMPASIPSDPRRASEVVLTLEHAQVTADTTAKFFKVPAGKKLRIDAVDYINPTGLTNDAANYFALQIRKGSTVMASWSTLTGAEGAIAADTFVALTLSATDANRVADAGDVLNYNLDETGTQTLPAGRFVIRGRYV